MYVVYVYVLAPVYPKSCKRLEFQDPEQTFADSFVNGRKCNMRTTWPALWQRLLLVALALLNWWEAAVLYRQRPVLAALNALAGLALAVLSSVGPRPGAKAQN